MKKNGKKGKAMEKLKLREKIAFGICDLGGNAFFTLIGFSLLIYLTDVVKMDPLLAGLAIAIGRVWDAVTDPLVGFLSDKTKSRWGRRKPYIFIGAILMFFAMVLLWSKPFFSHLIKPGRHHRS